MRRSLVAYESRDVDGLRACTDPAIELDWSQSRGWLAGVYRGIEDSLRFYEGYFEAFEKIEIEAEFIEAGDSVVVPNVAHQRGREGIEVSARSTLVFTLRDGKIVRIRLYQEKADALESVGLA